MTTWVLLLRGINVGGTGKLPMAALKSIMEDLGATEVATYIQSGNAVFSGDIDPAVWSQALADRIEADHGHRPRILLRTAADFRAIRDAYPYDEAWETPKTGHIWFCDAPPAEADLALLENLAKPNERFALIDGAFHLHAPDGIGRSKLAEKVERALGCPATARNLNSVAKLAAMIDER